MPAPDYSQEMRGTRFPVDQNTRPVSVLYTYDPVSSTVSPITSTGVTGVGGCLNTNIVGGIMQVENLHVVMDATGILNSSNARIDPGTEQTLQDILETLGGAVVTPAIVGQATYGSAAVIANSGSPVTVVTYTVPTGKRFRLTACRGWANVDVEFSVWIDSVQVDGYHTTPAELTMNITGAAIQYATVGQVVKISAKQWKTGTPPLVQAVIQGSLETLP